MVDDFSDNLFRNGQFKFIRVYYLDEYREAKSVMCKDLEVLGQHGVFFCEKKINLTKGVNIKIQIPMPDGVYSADAKFIEETALEDGGYQYLITHPETEKDSQRIFFRTNIEIPISLSVHTVAGEVRIYNKKTADLSPGGFTCKSVNSLFPDYENIEVSLGFPLRTIKCSAEYLHVHKIETEYGINYVQGFKFIGISRADADYIAQQCFLYQIKIKKDKNKHF